MCFHVGRDHLDGICGYICGSNLPSKCKHQATQYVLTACSLFFQATKHMFCHPVMFWRMAFHKNTAWQHMDLETFCGAQNNIPKQRSFTSVLLAQTQCLGNTAMLNPWKHFSFKDGLGNFCFLAAASVSSPAKGDWGGSHGHSNEWGNSASWTWWRSYGFCRGKGILQKEWHGAFFEPRDFKFHERLCPCRACATWAREQLRRVYPTIVEVKAPPGEPPSHLAADQTCMAK